MSPAAEVVYRDIDSSPALTDTIQKKINKLHRFSDEILFSRVVVEAPHKRHNKGKMFRASIELDLKGMPLNISHDDESVHIAVRDAFSVAERKIKEEGTKRRAH